MTRIPIPPSPISWVREKAASVLTSLSDRRRSVRRELESVYSREVLGAAMLTGAFTKAIEKIVNGEWVLLVLWIVVFVVANVVFVKWAEIAEEVDEALDSASDAVDDDNSE